jgi:hypothetical protein
MSFFQLRFEESMAPTRRRKRMDVAQRCPWCDRYALKDRACAYIFACGLDVSGFVQGAGCGRSWCWTCGKKFCGLYIDPATGQRLPEAKDYHDAACCRSEPGFVAAEYCPGGHSSHCAPRWDASSVNVDDARH